MAGGVLETSGMTKEFRGFVAVKEVDLHVQEGTIHALIGPNGAGKTTCFNLLTKFLQPTRGTIRFKGEERHNVDEYCISEGWVRVAAGKALDRRGQPMTMKLQGPVEAWFLDTANAGETPAD